MSQPTHMTTDATAPVGSEANPIIVDVMSQPAPDPAEVAVASLPVTAQHHEAEFRRTADLSANLPADVRRLVSEAASAITRTLGITDVAAATADAYRRNDTLYPQGRDRLVAEAIRKGHEDAAASIEDSDTRIAVAEASLYEAARPKLNQAEGATARMDVSMILDGKSSDAGAFTAAAKELARRDDAVGALVASPWFGDYLASRGVAADLREAVLTLVRASVVDAAAKSGDAKRAAAGKTSRALVSLKRARVAATTYTRLRLK